MEENVAGDLRFTETETLVFNGKEWVQLTLDNCDEVYGKPWVDFIPSLDKLNKMCNNNPTLKDAFEKFKVLYALSNKGD